jgi:hypothetical protein
MLVNCYINKYKNEAGLTIYYIPETSCCGKRIEWERGKALEVCPYCGNKYYKKPNLENKLFCLQDEFLEDYNKTGSTKVLGEKMFPLIQEYAINLIKAMVKGKKSLDREELESRSWDSATMLIDVIMKDPEHRMKYSFGKYLSDLCKSVCYSTKNHEHTYSLNSILRDGETELGETITKSLKEITGGVEKRGGIRIDNISEMADYQEDIVEKIVSLILKSANVLYKTTEDYSVKLLYMQGLLMKFKLEDDKILAGFFEEAGRLIKNYVEKGELLVFSYLKKGDITNDDDF